MPSLQDIPLTTIEGAPSRLEDYAGKVLLLVNVASKCGLTPQYEALEQLYRRKRAEGLEVLAFPANDFGGQEPGSEEEIRQFCDLNYQVSFPMFAKIAVTGADMHPLYRALVEAQPQASGDADGLRARLVGYGIVPEPAPGVLWNFEKFLIGRQGQVLSRWSPNTAPDDPALLAEIDRALAAG